MMTIERMTIVFNSDCDNSETNSDNEYYNSFLEFDSDLSDLE